MSKDLFDDYISKIWEPHARKFERSLLIMDRFAVHMMPEIIHKLNLLHTDVIFIPPGMTHILQPLDVYANKPMKDRMRDHFNTYINDDNIKLTKSSKNEFLNL